MISEKLFRIWLKGGGIAEHSASAIPCSPSLCFVRVVCARGVLIRLSRNVGIISGALLLKTQLWPRWSYLGGDSNGGTFEQSDLVLAAPNWKGTEIQLGTEGKFQMGKKEMVGMDELVEAVGAAISSAAPYKVARLQGS